MNNNANSGVPAIAGPNESLTILREVSHVYETLKVLRKRAARQAKQDGATYQLLSEALGVNRTSAYNLINRDAA